MPTPVGAHNPRIDFARDLLTKKGRREHHAFSFEGPTLLSEAVTSGTPIDAVYATQKAYDQTPIIRELESRGVPTHTVDDRTIRKISDVETPSGIVAITKIRLHDVADLLKEPGVILVLADLNDPGNAGTLLRSAEAFGIDRVIFGAQGAEPHNPKVVRSAMGAIFRMQIAVATPAEFQSVRAEWDVIGLASHGEPLSAVSWNNRTAVLVGNERHGIGAWEPLCARLASIPMRGQAESLNAAIAGSIALYEATKRAPGSEKNPLLSGCQGSVRKSKSQD